MIANLKSIAIISGIKTSKSDFRLITAAIYTAVVGVVKKEGFA